MTWAFANPPTTDKDRVRLLIGDVTSTDQLADGLFTDELLAYYLAVKGSVYGAAAQAARDAAAFFAKSFNVGLGGLAPALSQQYEHYRELAVRLEAEAARYAYLPFPYAGGISDQDKLDREADTDWPVPVFSVAQQ